MVVKSTAPERLPRLGRKQAQRLVTVATPDPGGLQKLPGLAHPIFLWRKVRGFLLRNAADRR